MGFPMVIISSAYRSPIKRGRSLGAACARNQADLHLGLTQIDAPGGHTVVTGHGKFQTAAKAVAIDGCHDGFGSCFQTADEACAFKCPPQKKVRDPLRPESE